MARILIAEHNQTTAAFLYHQLKKAGNQVEIVDNCLDAWRATARDDFDVVMIDIVMPGIDGFVLAQKALQENPEIQIIFLTGFAGVALDNYGAPKESPIPLTSRPFHLKDIASRVRYMLGQGGLPARAMANADSSRVIYADFSRKNAEAQSVSQ